MRTLRLALLPVGVAFGLAAEWASYDGSERGLAAADFVVGSLLIVCGVVAWDRRPESRVGALMSAAGFAWFLGTLFAPALYLHRGPLVHLHLSYPTGRLPTRMTVAVVAAAYVDAVVAPLARNDLLTLALSGAVGLAAVQVFVRTSGPARKAGGPALGAALAFAGVLALGALAQLTGDGDDSTILWIYDLVIASIAVVLLRDLLRGRWAEAVVTGLVVDLGNAGEVVTLRGKLARALGDPSLVVGYRLPGTSGFVDDTGQTVDLPAPGSGRAVTAIADGGAQIAILIHDEELLANRRLVESVAAAARIAVANAYLQAEARSRADELEESRRRIVEAGDAQRRRLERDLRLGAERRLDSIAALLGDARRMAAPVPGEAIGLLEAQLVEARDELREFAQGMHPATLTDGGLMPALGLLVERSTVDVRVTGEVERLPESVEVALYFVCSEALTNVAKHANASRATVELRQDRKRVVVTVSDDGIGGANASRGSGIQGLADRVEALGGQLSVESPLDSGTRIVASLPLDR
jgi:signal transduction histidine kinase